MKAPFNFPREVVSIGSCFAVQKLNGEPSFYHYAGATHNGEGWNGHRLSYHLNNGEITRRPDTETEKPYVLHECDNDWCINPKHLYLGDLKQNVKDMLERNKDWHRKVVEGRRANPPKLTEESRRKMASWKGRKHSEETKEKMRIAARKRKIVNGKLV